LIPHDPGSLEPVPPVTPESPGPPRPGGTTFTIEGRAAPALFVVGWLATIIGLGAILVGALAGGRGATLALVIGGSVALSVGLVAGAGSQGIERRARGSYAYTGPSPFLLFAASIPILILALLLIAIPLTAVGLAVDGPVGQLASVTLQALIWVGLIRLLLVDSGALTWAEMGLRRFDGRAVAELASGALWAGPVIVATIPVALVLQQVIPVAPISPLPPTGDDVGFAIQLVAGAIVAPIGEELLFRGFATTAWARTYGHRRGLVQAALFFSVVHVLNISAATAGEAFGLAVVGFATRIPVALALGWLFLRRRSIWAPLGLHATFNGVLLVLGEVALRNGITPG
jgi:membrane protease YdiL (CAAX protease family)